MVGTIADVYAQELSSRGYGYPLWYPEGRKGGATHLGDGVAQIGDVGYISDGVFVPLLNVTHAQDSRRFQKSGPPEGYIPLDYDRDEFGDQREAALQTRVISSKSVKHFVVSGNAQADAGVGGGGVGYKYSSDRERGALLLMKDDAMIDGVLNNTKFTDYMKKHHSSWVKWLMAKGHAFKPEQLILVRGTVKTTEWTVAAHQCEAGHHSVSVEGTFVTAASVGFEFSRDAQSVLSPEHRSGPETARRSPSPIPSTMIPDPSPLMATTPNLQLTHSRGDSASTFNAHEKKYDQCVFLPHYRIKYRLGLFRQIKAAAGDDELPDAEDDDDTMQITVETEGQGDSEADTPADFAGDAVDVVLDYILAYSDAEVAVACEEDINALMVHEKGIKEWPEDIQTWLQENKPKIDVEDGLGTLSLVEAIQRERRAKLTNMMNSANAPVGGGPPAGNNDADIGDNGGPPANNAILRSVKNIIGEGRLLRGKYLPEISVIPWPHMELVDREGETCAVSSMALSPDGQFIATSCDDSNVRLWNMSTGQLFRKWEGHEDIVWSVSYSPDGRRIASGSADTTIMLWDPNNAREDVDAGKLEGHDQDVWIVCYSPDGKRLASGAVDNTVRIWNMETLEEMHVFAEHGSQIMHLAFVKDGTRVVSCADTKGCIWNVESGDLLAKLEGHTGAIWSMALSRAGDRVITGSEDHSARIWDSTTGAELVILNEHTGPVWAVSFSPDDKEVVSGSYDSTLVTNDSWTGERHTVFSDRPSIVDSVSYSDNSKYIISGSADGRVKLWNRLEGRLIAEYQGHEDKVKNVIFTRDNKDLLSCSDDGSVRMWSIQDAVRLD